jgi:hypothetical protein
MNAISLLPYAICNMLSVICHRPYAICHLPPAICSLLSAICHLTPICHLLFESLGSCAAVTATATNTLTLTATPTLTLTPTPHRNHHSHSHRHRHPPAPLPLLPIIRRVKSQVPVSIRSRGGCVSGLVPRAPLQVYTRGVLDSIMRYGVWGVGYEYGRV